MVTSDGYICLKLEVTGERTQTKLNQQYICTNVTYMLKGVHGIKGVGKAGLEQE